MFTVRRADSGDVDSAVASLGEAFARDSLMHYFFDEAPQDFGATLIEFLSILLRVRIALGMPAFVLEQHNDAFGVAMGYDTSHPDWPPSFTVEWKRFEESIPGLAGRFAAYEAISESFQPLEPHYYLGVIGLHPSLQGQGAGKALMEIFCDRSASDPNSAGVYLETGSPKSLQFYLRNGFELRGEGRLDATPLWCLYRRT